MLHSFPFRYFSLILLEQALRLLNYLYEEISRAVFRELYGEQMSKALKPASNLVQNKISFFFFKSLQRTVVRINAKNGLRMKIGDWLHKRCPKFHTPISIYENHVNYA